jgi:CDP-diacylglycerol--glycerol-3-phosphate 3-phosphatidyltransferase
VRRYGTGTQQTGAAPGSEASPFAVLGSITSELDRISPRFEIQPEKIKILRSPDEFYTVLKVGVHHFWFRYGHQTNAWSRTRYQMLNEGYISRHCILEQRNMTWYACPLHLLRRF